MNKDKFDSITLDLNKAMKENELLVSELGELGDSLLLLIEDNSIKDALIKKLIARETPPDTTNEELINKLNDAIDSIKCRDIKISRYIEENKNLQTYCQLLKNLGIRGEEDE